MGHSSCGLSEERDQEGPHEGSETGKYGDTRRINGVRAPEEVGGEKTGKGREEGGEISLMYTQSQEGRARPCK